MNKMPKVSVILSGILNLDKAQAAILLLKPGFAFLVFSSIYGTAIDSIIDWPIVRRYNFISNPISVVEVDNNNKAWCGNTKPLIEITIPKGVQNLMELTLCIIAIVLPLCFFIIALAMILANRG